jgi:N-acetylglucosamine-6-phosphate deacetylase
MPTVAVSTLTLDKLKRAMKQEGVGTLDATINSLLQKASGVPQTMFGVDKGKGSVLTAKEHAEFQRSRS